ncbi:cobaltochelatase subunit CobN [Pseudonocardia petroleophila]|uniref:Cobaltochelatase subunit CobN n=1 Tax=Pseudonocardia petroleophila TaxID=37331 RepID=A0A7G7MBB7_9PSEU|nr:cobaltochelatase subunit CobN [Pseudonocardia petroleophila]QNG50078.1 cobaltochelatase subunit CobN [Pseudonocardia petroleophila]
MAPVVLLLSTADTELLAARAASDSPGSALYRTANPARVEPEGLPALLDGVDVVVLRLLGGRRAWPLGVDALVASGRPVVLLGGEAAPDAELMAASTVPAGVSSEALAYLAAGGTANLRELHRFLSDTVLFTGEGFAAPEATPEFGVLGDRERDPARPTVGVVFYRAHALSGNTAFVETLCDAIEARGANALPVFCASLRRADTELMALLSGVDALVTTVLAAGGTVASAASAGGEEDAWDAGALATLDVPVLQGLSLTTSRAVWADSDAALSPMDAAMQVAIPEFDGRIVTVPFSFKETAAGDDLPVYRADPERAARLAGLAVRHASLRRTPVAERKLAVVLSSYPTKHSRVGNAVGLDTPASAVVLLTALRDAGYTVGEFPQDSDELIHTLIAAGGHDVEWLTEEQLSAAPARVHLADYREWFAALPTALTDGIVEHWGEAPGSLYVDGDDIVLASLTFGNVLLMIQPPRGFGENPIAIYHDPDLPPSHHYLAAYRWLESEFGADAVVHLGKHGTLEWLPGKGLGLSAECAPDAVLGELPLVYPFIVNDPGEGTQAKRRGHAVVVDHLVPPMARADTYGEMAKLEQLLDEYATVQAMDPAKTPALRARIWEVVQAAQLHHDLHVDAAPGEDDFDDFVLHIDGYLCEVKDVQIRDGLHVLGGVPEGEAQVNLVLSILRATQVWGGKRALPGLRAALAAWAGLDEQQLLANPGAPLQQGHLHATSLHEGGLAAMPEVPADRIARLVTVAPGPARTGADLVDVLEGVARALVTGVQERGWSGGASVCAELLGEPVPDVVAVLEFGCAEVVPRLDRTTDEVSGVLHALDGGYVPAGPSGSPTRGLVNVLPTGRNFYSVDPKAIPSRSAWEIGTMLADSLIARHLADTGEYPRSVGLTVWGTSAMRTQGDDLAEILALIGARPVWDEASRRVTGFEIVPRAELGRPRIDVIVRISGFFRDAFPHVITLLDDAFAAVAELDEPDNHLREHVETDVAAHGDRRRATARIFGSKPGAYGAGLLPLIDARNWRSDADLAEVYAVWGGYAYGRGLDGREARADMEQSFRRISVAAKNQDTREHDIVDSDDYFQYHGGMVATVRALTGRTPAAYVGDSAVTDAVKTRTLAEETKRVFRARVVNPKWITAMQRHGYKGAFELAATVDYLFGYDATAGVVDDWMYTQLAESYVFDGTNRAFMEKSNPWALRGITERLLEAADRGMWAKPDDAVLDRLRQTYLELEGDLEGQG